MSKDTNPTDQSKVPFRQQIALQHDVYYFYQHIDLIKNVSCGLS